MLAGSSRSKRPDLRAPGCCREGLHVHLQPELQGQGGGDRCLDGVVKLECATPELFAAEGVESEDLAPFRLQGVAVGDDRAVLPKRSDAGGAGPGHGSSCQTEEQCERKGDPDSPSHRFLPVATKPAGGRLYGVARSWSRAKNWNSSPRSRSRSGRGWIVRSRLAAKATDGRPRSFRGKGCSAPGRHDATVPPLQSASAH